MIAARFDGVLSSGLGPRSRHDVGLSLVPPLNIRPVPKPFGVAIDRGGDHTVDLSRRGSLVYRRLGAYAPVLPQRRIVTLPLLGSSSIGPPIGQRHSPQHAALFVREMAGGEGHRRRDPGRRVSGGALF
jgi:hypothetical protein